MQFIDLSTQYKAIDEKVESAVLKVMRSGQYILGSEVEALERELAEYCCTKHCISCASGTDALVMALMAKNIGPGDAVYTTPFTFIATAESIATVGATPVFVDVDPQTFNIDTHALQKALATPAKDSEGRDLTPRAIMPVDLFGLPCDYDAIGALATQHGLTVIEDAAQSFGSTHQNRRAGGLGDIGCTSFFPAKPLGCYGDGGALFTDDDELNESLRSIRVHGQGSERYEHVRIGITGRLDAIQAAVLRVKLEIFADEIDARQRGAKAYTKAINDAGLPLTTPHIPDGYISAWAQYSLLAENADERDRFRQQLGDRGIPTAVYYPIPLHLQRAFVYLGYKLGDFPVSENLSERIFAIPMHPYLDDATIAQVVAALRGHD